MIMTMRYRVERYECVTVLRLTGGYVILGKSLNFSETDVCFKRDHRS